MRELPTETGGGTRRRVGGRADSFAVAKCVRSGYHNGAMSELYDGPPRDAVRDCAQKLKVCGHPVRLELLCAIAHGKEPCVSELWECVSQPQPVVSQHLAVLKEKGIVRSEVQGNRRIYSIVDPFVVELIDSLERFYASQQTESVP